MFEPVGSNALKDGYTWASEDQISGSEPDMISALRLAQNGERSKTAPWMGQHGILRYLDWAKTKLTGLGYTTQGTIQQVKNAYVSSIFRIPTNAGTMYLKITASVYVNTAAVEQQIANSVGSLPVFIALSPDGYAVITKEMPGHDCQSGNASSYKTWLENWAKSRDNLLLSLQMGAFLRQADAARRVCPGRTVQGVFYVGSRFPMGS